MVIVCSHDWVILFAAPNKDEFRGWFNAISSMTYDDYTGKRRSNKFHHNYGQKHNNSIDNPDARSGSIGSAGIASSKKVSLGLNIDKTKNGKNNNNSNNNNNNKSKSQDKNGIDNNICDSDSNHCHHKLYHHVVIQQIKRILQMIIITMNQMVDTKKQTEAHERTKSSIGTTNVLLLSTSGRTIDNALDVFVMMVHILSQFINVSYPCTIKVLIFVLCFFIL